jgi:hypothetical protein
MIFGITGQKYAGKDTAGEQLTRLLDTYAQGRVCETLKFASVLKTIAVRVFGLSERQIAGDLKEVIDPRYGWTPREIMQWIGTESGRNGDFAWAKEHERALRLAFEEADVRPGRTAWLDVVSKQIDAQQAQGRTSIVTDLRFLNEAAMLRSREAIVWRVVRPGMQQGAYSSHPSETEMDLIEVDATFVNDGTINALMFKIRDELARVFFARTQARQ